MAKSQLAARRPEDRLGALRHAFNLERGDGNMTMEEGLASYCDAQKKIGRYLL
jgi:hypothetical protein